MISDFQLALVGLAIVVVVAVIIYNRWQESKYKKRAEQAFGTSHPDVLIDDAVASATPPAAATRRQPNYPSQLINERVEPRLGASLPQYAADDANDSADLTPIGDTHSYPVSVEKVAPLMHYFSAPVLQAEVDSIALILADAPLEAAQYENVISQSKLLGKGVRWEGLQAGLWQPITLPVIEAYRELRVGMQLADRRGPVDVMALNQFNEMVAQYAASVGAVSQREDVAAAVLRAQTVDAFCADTDIEIAVNVIGKSGVTFAVTKVRGLAESSGFLALDSGEYVMRDEQGRVLYTLRNFDPAEPPGIKRTTGYLSGLTFALDVPRTPDATRTFERMFMVVMKIADVLQGEVVDDNCKLLTAAGRKVIADTITTITAQMEAKGVTAGSATALRLYA